MGRNEDEMEAYPQALPQREDMYVSFILINGCFSVFFSISFKIGGKEVAQKVSMEIKASIEASRAGSAETARSNNTFGPATGLAS